MNRIAVILLLLIFIALCVGFILCVIQREDFAKKPIKIIQSSYPHTGSTLLINLIHGAICPDEEFHLSKLIDKYLITKTHDVNFDKWIKNFPQYDIYIISSERDKKYNKKYYNYKNILIIKYDDILETDQNSLTNISNFIFHKLKSFLPKNTLPNIDEKIIIKNMETRIKNMNKLTKSIKNKPFSYYDKFYGIHGSHRNR